MYEILFLSTDEKKILYFAENTGILSRIFPYYKKKYNFRPYLNNLKKKFNNICMYEYFCWQVDSSYTSCLGPCYYLLDWK